MSSQAPAQIVATNERNYADAVASKITVQPLPEELTTQVEPVS
jgi:hypothetical protein